MTRKELCAVAEINAATFNVHRHKGDVPFSVERAEADDAKGRRWTRYSIHEAAALIAASHLASAQGVTWSEACAIIREAGAPLGAEQDAFADRGVHVARVEFLEERGSESAMMGRFKVFIGRPDEIGRGATEAAERFNDGRKPTWRVEVTSIASVNLSRAYRIAASRMAERGLEHFPEGQPEAGE